MDKNTSEHVNNSNSISTSHFLLSNTNLSQDSLDHKPQEGKGCLCSTGAVSRHGNEALLWRTTVVWRLSVLHNPLWERTQVQNHPYFAYFLTTPSRLKLFSPQQTPTRSLSSRILMSHGKSNYFRKDHMDFISSVSSQTVKKVCIFFGISFLAYRPLDAQQ